MFTSHIQKKHIHGSFSFKPKISTTPLKCPSFLFFLSHLSGGYVNSTGLLSFSSHISLTSPPSLQCILFPSLPSLIRRSENKVGKWVSSLVVTICTKGYQCRKSTKRQTPKDCYTDSLFQFRFCDHRMSNFRNTAVPVYT